MRRKVLVAALLAAAAVAAQPVGSATRAAIQLKGAVKLTPVNVEKHCTFTAGTNVLTALCQQSGIYSGKPGAAGAAYSWRWNLEVGKNGRTTGYAPEVGELALNFGGLGVLRVTTKGRQVPVGTPTTTAAKGKTTGRWTYKSGTKALKGRRGSGTYVFETSRTGPNTFQIARITLTGTLS
jgi:hypothetical protein